MSVFLCSVSARPCVCTCMHVWCGIPVLYGAEHARLYGTLDDVPREVVARDTPVDVRDYDEAGCVSFSLFPSRFASV